MRKITFCGKAKYILSMIWFPYIVAALAFWAISKFLDYSMITLWGAVVWIGVILISALIYFYVMALLARGKINKVRKSLELKEVEVSQVELNSSILTLDIAFLTFASWKLGEAGKKIFIIDNVNYEPVTSGSMSFLFLTMLAICYSSIKVNDKIKQYPGAKVERPEVIAKVEMLSACERRKNSFWEFSIIIISLVLLPVGLGVLFS